MMGAHSTARRRIEAAGDPVVSPDAVIADIAHLLVSEDSPAAILDAVADALEEVVPHDALTLHIADASAGLLLPAVVRDAHSGESLASGPVRYGDGDIGLAAQSGEPRIMNHHDQGADPGEAPAPIPKAPRSLIATPLLARGELKGVLCLYRFGQRNLFGKDEFETAIRFSDLAALAIDNGDIRAKLESLARTDHLTGLYNHRYFQERLLEEVSRANRSRTAVSLIICDIDDFKSVNDDYGHLMGDQVLQDVASTTRAICRAEDPVCRIGGEELAIIFPGQATSQVQVLAERLRQAIESLSFPMQTHITVSLGVAEAPLNASSPRDLFACADFALLSAKAQGKNRVRAYAGSTLGPRSGSSGDYPLSGQWQILARGREMTRWARTGWDRPDDQAVAHRSPEARPMAQIRMLHRLSSTLSQARDIAPIAEMIRVELESLIDYRSCQVYLLTDDGESLAAVSSPGRQEGRVRTAEGQPSRLGLKTATAAARSGRTIHLPGASSSTRRPDTPNGSMESLLAAPLRFDDQVIGVIVLSKPGADEFDEDDTRLLEVVAATAAIALENARLVEAQREATESLENAYLSTVETLANAMEAQDEYTCDHGRALAEMALSVGSELGMEEAQLKNLEFAALFHDIGKIGVPSEIIRKPGPLTTEEWHEMRRHPEIGERILAPVSFLQPIRPIVRACHERWDGHGYPDGLSDDRIPLHARIVFVCDAFHAMSTDRPYRNALPQDEAVRRIVEASGSQFDHRVVEAFVSLYKQGSIRLRREKLREDWHGPAFVREGGPPAHSKTS